MITDNQGRAVHGWETGAMGGAGRMVTAIARQALARERARALGLKERGPSPLEGMALAWARDQEAEARRAEQERGPIPGPIKTHPFSLQRVPLQVRQLTPEENEAGWKPYVLPRQTTGKGRRTRPGGIPVGSFATRLIQRERAAGSGLGVMDPRAQSLVEAAKRWRGGGRQ